MGNGEEEQEEDWGPAEGDEDWDPCGLATQPAPEPSPPRGKGKSRGKGGRGSGSGSSDSSSSRGSGSEQWQSFLTLLPTMMQMCKDYQEESPERGRRRQRGDGASRSPRGRSVY